MPGIFLFRTCMTLTLQEFNEKFTIKVTVVQRKNGDDGIESTTVGVQLTRIDVPDCMYFEQNVAATSGVADSDVVNQALQLLTSAVREYATDSVQRTAAVVNSAYVPSEEFSECCCIDLAAFGEKYDVKIVRFEGYPASRPIDWCVGFSVSCKDENSVPDMYVDTNVRLDFGVCNKCVDILSMAWKDVKDRVGPWASTHCTKSLLIDAVLPPISSWDSFTIAS